MQSFFSNDTAWFKQSLSNKPLVCKLKNITLVVCDIDGSLTDGTIYVSQTEECARGFSIVDGFIFKPARQAGIDIAFMTGKLNNSVLVRAKTLGVPEHLISQGISDKREATKKLLSSLSIADNAMLMFGDDVLDAQVKINDPDHLFACPADAPFYIQSIADIVIPRDGGRHAFRLLVDLILFIRGQHPMQSVIENVVNDTSAVK